MQQDELLGLMLSSDLRQTLEVHRAQRSESLKRFSIMISEQVLYMQYVLVLMPELSLFLSFITDRALNPQKFCCI